MSQEVVFTACPRGRTEAGLELSVFVSPRLDPGATEGQLEDFPDFLDWPGTEITWHVAVEGTGHEAGVVSDPPSSELWTTLFSAETLVRPHAVPDYTGHLIYSYPAGNLADLIEELYQHVATEYPTEHPPSADLLATAIADLAHVDQVSDDPPRWRDKRLLLLRDLKAAIGEGRALPPGPADTEMDSFQLWNFHRPGVRIPDPEQPPRFDFAQVVALCGEHFGLLRRLGLVHDLVVPVEVDDGPIRVQVWPEWTPADPADSVDVRPITRCVVDGDRFLAEPRDPAAFVDGRLPLDDPTAHRLVQVDVDGGILKLGMLARNLLQARSYRTADTPEAEPLPSLRSGGFSVVRTGQAAQLADHLQHSLALNAEIVGGGDPELYAEDITLGTRWDVWTSITDAWHSLQARLGTYRFLGPDLESVVSEETIAEEAAVVEVPTERIEDAEGFPEAPALYMQESLVGWDGWSLAAVRPGLTHLPDDSVGETPDDPPPEYPLAMDIVAAPGSLPMLRFGADYRLRGRAVDLAGNSVPLDDDPSAAVGPVTYRRLEPVAAPPVLLRHPLGEGESAEHVALRSEHDEVAETDAERHIAPPRTTQRTAEEHGRYDVDGALDPNAHAAIVAREAETFEPSAGNGGFEDSATGQPYFPTATLPVLYLPDPVARGVALRGLPGHDPDEVELIPFLDDPDDWPDAVPTRLVVVEGDGPPAVAPVDGAWELVVQLPKAEIATVRYSCYIDPGELDESGIWHLMTAKPGVTGAQIAAWEQAAAEGRLWMVTPYRTLTLVHAVRQPLKPPTFTGTLSPLREEGETFTRLNGQLDFSRMSTGRVDLHATWREPVDLGPGGGVPADPPLVGDTMRVHEDRLVVPLAERDDEEEGDEDLLPIGQRHEFHDTKRRVITYTAVATSRFTEYFVDRAQVGLATGETIVLTPGAIVEASETVRVVADGTVLTRDEHYVVDYEGGAISRADDSELPDGTEVEVSWLVEPVSRSSLEAAEEAHRTEVVDVPSSARPAAPKVLYAVPTHRWTQTPTSSSAEGGGLRIYLDRPFMDTGVGQLLGVVLDRDPADPDEDLAAYTTRWGFDPMQAPTDPLVPTTYSPTPGDFPLVAEEGHGPDVVLAENGAVVDVVGHEAAFDEDRGLWFCDIKVDAGGAHLPFIRLALASFQPNSVVEPPFGGLHLSRVVLADIVQLTPDRTATVVIVTTPGGGSDTVQITVAGPTPPPDPSGITGTLVTAHLESRLDGDDEILGWTPVSGAGAQTTLRRVGERGETTWAGELQLPASRRRGGREHLRVVIEEWQTFAGDADGDLREPEPDRTGRGDEREPDREPGGAPTRRLLYRDLIPLSR